MKQLGAGKLLTIALLMSFFSSSAYGYPLLKTTLEEIIGFKDFLPLPVPPAEGPRVSYEQEFENTINSRDLILNNLDSRVDILIPFKNKKGGLDFSLTKNDSYSYSVLNDTQLILDSHSDKIKFLYDNEINDYIDFGLGLGQYQNSSLSSNQTLNYYFKLNLRPYQNFLIEYSNEKEQDGSFIKINYDGNWKKYPAFAIFNSYKIGLSTQIGKRIRVKIQDQQYDASPIDLISSKRGLLYAQGVNLGAEALFDIKPGVKLGGRIARISNNQDVKFYNDQLKVAYIQTELVTLLGNLGMLWELQDCNLAFNLVQSTTSIGGRGKVFAENVPDIPANLTNIDKYGELDGYIVANGCQFNAKRFLNDRLILSGDIQFASLFFSGTASKWDTWFFGVIKQLDSTYKSPIKTLTFIAGEIGLTYKLSQKIETKYSFKQIIPLSLEKVEGTGTGNGLDFGGPAGSGGSIQQFSLVYTF